MTEIIKETGIFIIVAEAMVYLSPSEVYAKYIKLIVGMVLVVRLALPVLSLISGEGIPFSLEELPEYVTETENTGRAGREAETVSWQVQAKTTSQFGKMDRSEMGTLSFERGSSKTQENPVQIQMEKEIRQRLERTDSGAQIREVKFQEREDDSLYLLITVEEPEKSGTVRAEETDDPGKEGRKAWLQQQRQYFAETLQMEMSDVEVEVSAWG